MVNLSSIKYKLHDLQKKTHISIILWFMISYRICTISWYSHRVHNNKLNVYCLGFGIATPIQLTDPVVREPPSQSGFKRSDSSKLAELLKLRAAIEKMKNSPSQQQGNNFFLQTFKNYGNNEGTEVYADLRMEQSKKNLLTLPTDPNQMYIKKGQNGPTAEVILYPMGQLLSGPLGQQFTHRNSDETIYERSAKVKDEVSSGSEEGSVESENPKGILQTIMRSAQDDFKIVGNVFKHLTGSENK